MPSVRKTLQYQVEHLYGDYMDIETVFERWTNGEILESLLDKYNLAQTESFLERRLKKISEVEESKADQAFSDLLQLVAFINEVSRKKPDILGKLGKLLALLKRTLNRIAKMQAAASYSITASLPLGVSVNLSWKPQELDDTDA